MNSNFVIEKTALEYFMKLFYDSKKGKIYELLTYG